MGRSDQDLNMVSLWFQGSFALAILIQMVEDEESSTSFSFQHGEARCVCSALKQRCVILLLVDLVARKGNHATKNSVDFYLIYCLSRLCL